MPKDKKNSDPFLGLSFDDLNEWAGSKIVSRGRNYHRQGRVSELAITDDGALIAWVKGSKKYAIRVAMDEDGLPQSVCSCPYTIDCKHGVAVVFEYLKRVENDRFVPKAKNGDERLKLWEDEDRDNESDDVENALSGGMQKEIDAFLKGKTRAQLIELIHELAAIHPETGQDLFDRGQIVSGSVKSLVTRLRLEIREIGEERGWRNYWQDEGHTPDYSGIRTKLETLLKAGHADAVVALGEELINTGIRQVEESHDEGETAMEIERCMPVMVKALGHSSMDTADKLAWAVDAVLKDSFNICETIAEYLHRKHPQTAWNTLADRLLTRLNGLKSIKGADEFSRNYARDRISDWVLHALDRAGREDEIIPLCKAEAEKTGSYDRLIKRLIAARHYEHAERWIQEGIRTTHEKWPGIAASLSNKLLEIRTRQKNWPVVAAMHAEEFVRHPSRKIFADCKKTSGKVKAWPKVRESLLTYLENGVLPWKQGGWPLPESGLDTPKAAARSERFPMVDDLVHIAILEKKPDQVLRWYNRLPKNRFGWHGVDDDEVAAAVQTHAPDRAVAIWKNKAERLIAQVKPSAYQEAAKYLRKAGKVMANENKQTEWERYLRDLRAKQIRKRRLIEILDGLVGRPILKKRH